MSVNRTNRNSLGVLNYFFIFLNTWLCVVFVVSLWVCDLWVEDAIVVSIWIRRTKIFVPFCANMLLKFDTNLLVRLVRSWARPNRTNRDRNCSVFVFQLTDRSLFFDDRTFKLTEKPISSVRSDRTPRPTSMHVPSQARLYKHTYFFYKRNKESK